MLALIFILLFVIALYTYMRYRLLFRAIKKANVTQDWSGEFWVGSKGKAQFSMLILGDSVAAGLGVDEFEKTFAGRIAKELSSSFYVRLVNRAQPGILLPRLAIEEVKGPWDLIIVITGSNELTHRMNPRLVRSSLNKLLRHLVDEGRFVVLAGPGDVASAKVLPFWYRMPLSFRQKDFARMMARVAQQHDVLYVNPLEHPNSQAYFASDHLHPNALGHKAWFEIIWGTVEPELVRRRVVGANTDEKIPYLKSTDTEKIKSSNIRYLIGEGLFWLHTLIVIFMLVMGLFLSIWWVLLVLVLQRIHLYLFDGCAITRLEEFEGGIPEGMVYFQFAWKRFFGKNLSKEGSHVVYLYVTTISLVVTLLANVYHLRI